MLAGVSSAITSRLPRRALGLAALARAAARFLGPAPASRPFARGPAPAGAGRRPRPAGAMIRANAYAASRSMRATRATGSPRGYTPSMPEVTSRSPFWMSAFAAMKRSSIVVAVAGAEGDGAQAVAHDLHRDRLVLVGDQRHLGEERVHARHLADHAGSSITGCAGREPCCAPRSMNTLRLNGSRAGVDDLREIESRSAARAPRAAASAARSRRAPLRARAAAPRPAAFRRGAPRSPRSCAWVVKNSRLWASADTGAIASCCERDRRRGRAAGASAPRSGTARRAP